MFCYNKLYVQDNLLYVFNLVSKFAIFWKNLKLKFLLNVLSLTNLTPNIFFLKTFLSSFTKVLFTSEVAWYDCKLLNCFLSPKTNIFFALIKAGKAWAILTCDASSIIIRSNKPFSNCIYSAKSLTLEIMHGKAFFNFSKSFFGNFCLPLIILLRTLAVF